MSMPPKPISPVVELEIQASQIIERLEEAVEKAGDAITAIEQAEPAAELTPEHEAALGLKGHTWRNTQGFLQAKAKLVPQILSLLEDLVVYEGGDENELDEDVPAVTSLPVLSEAAKLALVVESVAAYANTLDRPHLLNIDHRVHNDTTRWIAHLFRSPDSLAFYHTDPVESLTRLTRLLLHQRYPAFLQRGPPALSPPPLLYSGGTGLGAAQGACRGAGLGLDSVRSVEVNPEALEAVFQKDAAAGKLPLLLLAEAGSLLTGHVDDLVRVHDVCKRHHVWLHVRGHALSTLVLLNASSVLSRVCDSMILTPASWLGVPSLPTIMLYRPLEIHNDNTPRTVGVSREATLPLIAGLVPDQSSRRITALSTWLTLQAMGREGVTNRLRTAFEATEMLHQRLSKYPCLRQLGQAPREPDSALGLAQLMEKPVSSPSQMFEMTATTIVFQFVPEDISPNDRVPVYYDKLNSWLGQILQRDCLSTPVELCDLEPAGLVLRICPLENPQDLTPEALELFCACLEQQLEILLATVRLKETFIEQVTSNPRLCLVEMAGWAGLGGVRYLPTGLENVETDQNKQEVNKLNIELVHKLRNTDTAFSLGEGSDGLVCVRFGMVTSDTDVEELLTLVTVVGREVEESSKYLDTMVEIVKKGIETATLDLQKENEDRLWQEGILRHVPVFGSIVNWWSPKDKETGVKGRSLNLQAGVVESTENIYRYHMQLQQGASSPPGAKPPPQPLPQPLVQTPVVPPSTPIPGSEEPQHSRTSSHATNASDPF